MNRDQVDMSTDTVIEMLTPVELELDVDLE